MAHLSMTTKRARIIATALKNFILPIAVLTAATIGLGLLITHYLVHLWPFTIEEQATRGLVAYRTPFLDRVADSVSRIVYIAGLVTVVFLVGGTMRIVYHRWRELLFLAALVLSQLTVYMFTSRLLIRPRPAVPKLDHFNPMRSFPSGHVAAAMALYGGIALILTMHSRGRRQVVAWVMLSTVPVAVGMSRIYRGMHYPSDVVAGFLIGLGCLWILRRAMFPPANQRGSPAHEMQDSVPNHQSPPG
jgi:membrane-associated phospholipid phosphatase